MTDGAQPDLNVARLLGGSGRYGLISTIGFDAVLPWLAVTILERNGVPMVPAFVAAALFPLASVLISWVRRRRVEAIGIIVVVTLIAGAGLALANGDVRFSVVKAAPAFLLFGIACLLSLFARRPLMFYVARYFTTEGDAAKRAAWDARLAIPGFVHAMRRLTAVWGVVAAIEASLGIACAFVLPPQLALVVEPSLAFTTVAALLFWTVAFARRQARRGAP